MLKVCHSLKYIIGTFVLIGYFSLLIYTPIHMIEMAEMNMPMEHCPFAMDQHVICNMTISEHIREWQNWLLGFFPSFTILKSALVVFTFSYLLFFTFQSLRQLLYYKLKSNVRSHSFLQTLFSQGILHTKAY